MCVNSDESVVNVTTLVLVPVVLVSKDLTLGKNLGAQLGPEIVETGNL